MGAPAPPLPLPLPLPFMMGITPALLLPGDAALAIEPADVMGVDGDDDDDTRSTVTAAGDRTRLKSLPLPLPLPGVDGTIPPLLPASALLSDGSALASLNCTG